MKDERAKIGAILKKAIKDKGYTQEDFAEKVGIGFSSLKGYLNGAKVYNYELLIRFADVLECSYDYLLGKSISPKREYVDVSNATGLSDESIEKLGKYARMDVESQYRQGFYNGINAIICSDALVNSISNYLIFDNSLVKDTKAFNNALNGLLMKNDDIRQAGVEEMPISMDVYILLDVINRLNDTKVLVNKDYVNNVHSAITKAVECINVVSGSKQDEK